MLFINGVARGFNQQRNSFVSFLFYKDIQIMKHTQLIKTLISFLIGLAIAFSFIYLSESTLSQSYFEFVVIVLLCILPSVFKFILDNHTAPYLKQLGKDKAKLESIDKLTEVAESIKSGFKSQSQELQSKLDVFTGVTLNLKAEEHEAVKKLFISFCYWHNQLVLPPHIFSSEIMKEEMKETNEAYRLVLQDQALLALYIDDQKLKDSFKKCKEYCSNTLSPLKLDITSKLLPSVISIESSTSGFNSILNSAEFKKIKSEIKLTNKDLLHEFKVHMKEFDKANDELRPLLQEFTNACMSNLRAAASSVNAESGE